jgi:hypothetical protein
MRKQSTKSVALNWDRIIQKRARINGGQALGKLALNNEESFFVPSSRFRKHQTSESQLTEFDLSVVPRCLKFEGVESI